MSIKAPMLEDNILHIAEMVREDYPFKPNNLENVLRDFITVNVANRIAPSPLTYTQNDEECVFSYGYLVPQADANEIPAQCVVVLMLRPLGGAGTQVDESEKTIAVYNGLADQANLSQPAKLLTFENMYYCKEERRGDGTPPEKSHLIKEDRLYVIAGSFIAGDIIANLTVVHLKNKSLSDNLAVGSSIH